MPRPRRLSGLAHPIECQGRAERVRTECPVCPDLLRPGLAPAASSLLRAPSSTAPAALLFRRPSASAALVRGRRPSRLPTPSSARSASARLGFRQQSTGASRVLASPLVECVRVR
ncbi:unnamed protein product [Prorocentrum cordatum]|uniref:Uncharacterized protein n=1 Tax=Prorocentrum cordatum TaxID=2364126 RepID=A0ABN9W6I3_9DINO|nr:unnamed protein product [Polarella glacialis]